MPQRFSIILFLLMSLFAGLSAQNINIITPGEHLGWQNYSYDQSGNEYKTEMEQGSIWWGIYQKGERFVAIQEKLNWEVPGNFVLQSSDGKDPLFWVQGIDGMSKAGFAYFFDRYSLKGPTAVTFVGAKSCLLLLKDDPNYERFAAYQAGELISTGTEMYKDTIGVFEGFPIHQIGNYQYPEELRFITFFIGDLNGDARPDFLIMQRSHHEMPTLELFLSDASLGRTRWHSVAKFVEWS